MADAPGGVACADLSIGGGSTAVADRTGIPPDLDSGGGGAQHLGGGGGVGGAQNLGGGGGVGGAQNIGGGGGVGGYWFPPMVPCFGDGFAGRSVPHPVPPFFGHGVHGGSVSQGVPYFFGPAVLERPVCSQPCFSPAMFSLAPQIPFAGSPAPSQAIVGAGHGAVGSSVQAYLGSGGALPSCMDLMASVGRPTHNACEAVDAGEDGGPSDMSDDEDQLVGVGEELTESSEAEADGRQAEVIGDGDIGASPVRVLGGDAGHNVHGDDDFGDDEYSEDECEDSPADPLRKEFCVGYSSADDDTCKRTVSVSGNSMLETVKATMDNSVRSAPDIGNIGGEAGDALPQSTGNCVSGNGVGVVNDGADGNVHLDEGASSRLIKWQKCSPYACNESVLGAVEAALRNPAGQDYIFLPKVGVTFASLADAKQLYNLYSWERGFSIRMFTNNNKSGVVDSNGEKVKNMQEFRCQRAGKPGKNVKSTTMCGCPARLRLLRNKNNEWYIKAFVEEHNHELVKSCGEKRHMTSHQYIDQSTKDLVRYMRENNISLSKVNSICGSIAGSVNNLTFTKNRLKTLCSKIASEMLADDIQKTMVAFLKKQEEDPNFVFKFQTDGDNRVTALMWSSGNSRKMYSHFGDAVTFDTTFNTNIYKMPFGMFVGVNNHFQSVIFAGVLLTSEDTQSFKWAFKTFVGMMGNKPPTTMLTDQCAAMGAAIREVLPGTAHRWCKWHVMKKVVETLGHVFNSNKGFNDEFNKVVNHMLSKEEFELAWGAVLKKYGLSGNPELIRAFEARKMWAKAWFKDIYCARMTSTQRSESANHVLKNLVPATASLNLFFQQYTTMVYEQEKKYYAEERRTKQRDVKLHFRWPIEAHALKIYTRAAYELFLEELLKSTSYVIDQNRSDQDQEQNVYHVIHVESEQRERWSKVDFRVNVNEENGFYSCECNLYGHFGILCSHALLLMVQRGITKIPDVHIMARWTRDACVSTPSHLVPVQERSTALDSPYFRTSILENTFREVVSIANSDRQCFDIAVSELSAMLKKMKMNRDSVRTDCQVGYASNDSGYESSQGRSASCRYYSDSEGQPLQIVDSNTGASIDINSLKPPLIRRAMGRPTHARFRSHKEIKITRKKIQKQRKRKEGDSGPVKQTRFCRICRDPSHDARRCPEANQSDN